MISLKENIKKSGLKITNANTAVYNLLQKTTKPLSAQKIWSKLGKKNNLVSIYRILERLHEANVIHQDTIADKNQRPEKVYYLSDDHHHHFVCQKCAKIFCLPCPIKIKLPKNFKLNGHQIQISGLCPKCNN
jgi:Fe2+ or Zn2+ uptake regulation protein